MDIPAGAPDNSPATGPIRLFVYGSLRLGEANQMARLLRRNARYLGTGTVCARLYEVSWYPGMTASDDADGAGDCVTGDVFELDPAAVTDVLATLDDYEGDTFERRTVDVAMAGETRVSAFTYLYAGSVAGLPRVAHGDWLRRGRTPAREAVPPPPAGLAPPERRG